MQTRDKLTLILGKIELEILKLQADNSDSLMLDNLINFKANTIQCIKECEDNTDLDEICQDVQDALRGFEFL